MCGRSHRRADGFSVFGDGERGLIDGANSLSEGRVEGEFCRLGMRG